MRIIRDISQPLIFHSGAVKEEWKEGLWKYLFLTVALRRQEGREGQGGQGQVSPLLRAGYFWSMREPSARQLEVLNFREELEKESSQLTGMPIASLTNVIGVYKKWEPGATKLTLFRRKLCEITLGEISSETYKELQHFMQDCQLNLNWILAGTEEDLIWKFLRG